MLNSKASDRGIWTDSAYVSEEHLAKLREMGLEPHRCEKGYREHPLTDAQKATSKTPRTAVFSNKFILPFAQPRVNGGNRLSDKKLEISEEMQEIL